MFEPKLVLKAAQELSNAKKSVQKNAKRLLFMSTCNELSSSLQLLKQAQSSADICLWQPGQDLKANADWFCVVLQLSQLAPELISQYLAIASQWPVLIISDIEPTDFKSIDLESTVETSLCENTLVDLEWLSEKDLQISHLNRAIDMAVLKYRLSHRDIKEAAEYVVEDGILDRKQFFQQAGCLLAEQKQYFQLIQCRWLKTKAADLSWQDSKLLETRFERFLAKYVMKETLLGRLMEEQTGLLSVNNEPMDEQDLNNFHQLCQQEFSDIKLMVYTSTAIQVNDAESLALAMQQAVQEIARDKLVQETKLEWQSYQQANIGLMSGMHLALQRQEFVLHYQPQLHVETGEWVGAEALIRWQHPSFGLLPPAAFINEAETTGLIQVLGRWALQEAIRAWKTIQLDTGRKICMAVNVSFPQVADVNFADEVLQALDENDMPYEYLEVELTETTVIKDEQVTMDNLNRLLKAGIKISLDDFGTGFSSLSHLSDLPITGIKLDRAFVSPLADECAQAHIAAAMINLAKQLNLETTAEGVEDIRCMEKIKQLGCDRVQGYYFSRPLALEDLLIRAEQNFAPVTQADIIKGY
ncbi:MAG: EAL domain-containing protein [Oleispira sp.]|nr:EAL domain-containing protein [Oleispira sp.]MBL4879989.1 EAL domain-containing protein [Oleispira sp.]